MDTDRPCSPPPSLSAWQRTVVALSRAANRVLTSLPIGGWLAARLDRGRDYTFPEIPLRRGGAGLDGLTVAFVSDLHAGTFMGEAELHTIFARVAACAPDLVCLGGDLVENEPAEIELFRGPIRRISPPLGIFAVPGNHEYHQEDILPVWRKALEAMGVRVLLNEGISVSRNGARLWIAGVDDPRHSTMDLAAALEGRGPDEPTLLLAHRPDTFVLACERDVDLTLSGHTHGGQITFFGWIPFKHSVHGYVRGLHERNGVRLYVSRGAGVTTVPLRLGVRGEVPVIRLRVPL